MQLNFQMPHVPQTVVIIGCGGTGGRVIPPIAQLIRNNPMLIEPEMVLVDFDEVEAKNLARQNFISKDVGSNKAEVLAERYSRAFNVKITPITVAAGTSEYRQALELNGLNLRLSGPTLYILCVDSVAARKQIISSALELQRGSAYESVVIDAGNEDIFGQVKLWTTSNLPDDLAISMETATNWFQGVIPPTVQAREDGKVVLQGIPPDIDEYMTMQEGQGTGSCADLDQTLAINNMMAAACISMAQNILLNKPMSYVEWRFDLFNGIESIPYTWDLLVDRVARNSMSRRTHKSTVFDTALCASQVFSGQIADMCQRLESDLFGDGVMLEQSKILREMFKPGQSYLPVTRLRAMDPGRYDPYVEAWGNGYSKPEAPAEVVELFKAFEAHIAAMQAAMDERQRSMEPVPTPPVEAETL